MIIQVVGLEGETIIASTPLFRELGDGKDEWYRRMEECFEIDRFDIQYNKTEKISSKFMTKVPDDIVVYYSYSLRKLHEIVQPDILICFEYEKFKCGGGCCHYDYTQKMGGPGAINYYYAKLKINVYDDYGETVINVNGKIHSYDKLAKDEMISFVKMHIDDYLAVHPELLHQINENKMLGEVLERLEEKIETLTKIVSGR